MYGQKSHEQELTALLPETMEGWHTEAPDQVYDQQSIYQYLNGGAELYLSYNFRELVSRTYHRSEQPAIVVDIFDMGRSEDAFGAFSHSRETIAADFGQGSEYYDGFLLFWRDRYLVSIVSNPETDASRQAVRALAAHIADQIGMDGPFPAILKRLPEKGLNENSIRYFHNYIWMNIHYFIADENILGIGRDTDAIAATYGEAPHRQVLLIVEYPNLERAAEAEQMFRHRFLFDLKTAGALQLEDGTWAAIRRAERTVVVVLNAPDEDKTIELLDQAMKET